MDHDTPFFQRFYPWELLLLAELVEQYRDTELALRYLQSEMQRIERRAIDRQLRVTNNHLPRLGPSTVKSHDAQ